MMNVIMKPPAPTARNIDRGSISGQQRPSKIKAYLQIPRNLRISRYVLNIPSMFPKYTCLRNFVARRIVLLSDPMFLDVKLFDWRIWNRDL